MNIRGEFSTRQKASRERASTTPLNRSVARACARRPVDSGQARSLGPTACARPATLPSVFVYIDLAPLLLRGDLVGFKGKRCGNYVDALAKETEAARAPSQNPPQRRHRLAWSSELLQRLRGVAVVMIHGATLEPAAPQFWR